MLVTTIAAALMESHVLTVYAAVCGAALALVAVCLSAVSLAIHYVQRDKHPQVQELHTRCDQLQLAQSDMLDRIEHWTRRDRVRRLREGPEQSNPLDPSQLPTNDKQGLRLKARQMGVIK